jgi:hypothetical protein
MTTEDLTNYDEFGGSIIYAPTIPAILSRLDVAEQAIDDMDEAYEVTTYGRVFWDSMARKIECGDILLWKSGGFFNYFLSYGIVLTIFQDIPYRVLVLNTKKNKVTLWSTFNKTILAKHDNYDIIPNKFREVWDI